MIFRCQERTLECFKNTMGTRGFAILEHSYDAPVSLMLIYTNFTDA